MNTRLRLRKLCFYACMAFYSLVSFADFTNGNFEEAYTIPTPITLPYLNIPGWDSVGYIFSGYTSGLILPPKSLSDIQLTAAAPAPYGITDIVSGTTQTLNDWFLAGATPTPTLLLPGTGSNSAMINLRSVHDKKSVSGTSGKPSGWATYSKQATALSQRITLESGDFSSDGKVHIRFKAAPVFENPAHTAKQQPFYAIQVNNLTTGREGSNPLFFQWSYSGQPGIPWQTLATKGTNSGSNATYNYTDWQNFDIPLGSDLAHVGDAIELIVLAAGCSPGGHDGHIYLDNVTTKAPVGLLISAVGPATTTPGGQITYTYTYTNNGLSAVNNVQVNAHMPQTQNTPTPYDTLFVSAITSTGTCTYDALQNILNCNFGTLAAQATGTFTMTVDVPADWQPSYGPINNGNFPISGTGVNPVLGNLVQTQIEPAPPPTTSSFLVVDVSGLLIGGNNPSIQSGTSYTGTYSCTNTPPQATAIATNATCEISNLPDGLNLTGCISNTTGNPWTQPADIGIGETITCHISGTPISSISREYDALISSDASNNTNAVTNHAIVPYSIYNNPVSIPATLNGSPVLNPAYICCGRPVVLYDLPIESDLPATYTVLSTTGQVVCMIGHAGANDYVKMFGRPGSCTIQGSKNGELSSPLVLVAS